MGRGHKALKLTVPECQTDHFQLNLQETSNDYVSKLPDDVLSMITSMLDLKLSVQTSILSKRWRYVWTNHPDLIFDHFNVLGLTYEQLKEKFRGANTVFVNHVDQILQQRLKGDGDIKTLRVSFELGKCFSQYIDRWISCAVRKGVETIDLDFFIFSFNYRFSASLRQQFRRYNFSLIRTVSENKGSLKHVRVSFCNFRGQSSSKRFGSLVSLQFKRVNISSSQLSKVLESCPLLEKLSLHSCSTLTSLRIGHSNHNPLLKILSFKSCFNCTEFDIINTHNLISLELQQLNLNNLQLTNLLIVCPILEELTLSINYELTNLRIGDSNNNNTSLKILTLFNCVHLKEIDLCCNNLHTLDYYGLSTELSFKIKTPSLVNAITFESKYFGLPSNSSVRLDIPMMVNTILSWELSLKNYMFRRLILYVIAGMNDEESALIKYIDSRFHVFWEGSGKSTHSSKSAVIMQ